MDAEQKAFRKLEYYSLVSKVCTELNNHLGLEDRILGKLVITTYALLAGFVIHLAKKNNTFESFKSALNKHEAEFSVSFSLCTSFQDALIASILRLVQKMLPKPSRKVSKEPRNTEIQKAETFEEGAAKADTIARKMLVPALCIPDESAEQLVKFALFICFNNNLHICFI